MSAVPRVAAGVGLLLAAAAAGPAIAQCPDGTPPPCGPRATPPAVRSIAILPFASRSPDTADAYLAEGMTEEVGNHLTQLSRLQVRARSLVLAQWRRTPDPLDAARRLNVAWFVQGTVRRAASQLLVSVELVRPATGEQVWARRFVRPDADLFAAQAEVAESVAVVVAGRLTPRERRVLVLRPTRNNEAYRLYLYGNSLMARRSRDEVRRALDAYLEAARLDPAFAAAWARVSMACIVRLSWPGWVEGVEADSLRALVRSAARRAVSLDSLSGEAWLALGWAGVDDDLGTKRTYFERSFRLDSLNPELFHAWAQLYTAASVRGLVIYEAAAPLYRRALALDPSLRNTWRQLAVATLYEGRLAEAEALLDTALAFGAWDGAFFNRSYVRVLRGNALGALADLAELERLAGPNPGLRALITVQLGDSAAARAEQARLRAAADSGALFVVWELARYSMALGLRDDAISALQRARELAGPNEPRCSPTANCSVSIRVWRELHDPIYAPLRGDPRFQRLWEETRPRVPWLEGYR